VAHKRAGAPMQCLHDGLLVGVVVGVPGLLI
jgi:hypothetical protein